MAAINMINIHVSHVLSNLLLLHQGNLYDLLKNLHKTSSSTLQ